MLEYLGSIRENELLVHRNGEGESPRCLQKTFCVADLWKDYNERADPDMQVQQSLFRTVFAENYDIHLNPKNGDTISEDQKVAIATSQDVVEEIKVEQLLSENMDVKNEEGWPSEFDNNQQCFDEMQSAN